MSKDGYVDCEKYKNRLKHFDDYCEVRKLSELFIDKKDFELISFLNSSLQRENQSLLHLIADDKWAFFADNEKLHFEILYFMIKHISELMIDNFYNQNV